MLSCVHCYLWYTYAFGYNQVPWKQVKDNLRDLIWVMIRVSSSSSSAAAAVAAAVVVVVVVVVVAVLVVVAAVVQK